MAEHKAATGRQRRTQDSASAPALALCPPPTALNAALHPQSSKKLGARTQQRRITVVQIHWMHCSDQAFRRRKTSGYLHALSLLICTQLMHIWKISLSNFLTGKISTDRCDLREAMFGVASANKNSYMPHICRITARNFHLNIRIAEP